MTEEIEPFKISHSTENWILQTGARRLELRSWGASGASLDQGKALEMEDAAARLLGEAEGLLSFERARAMWHCKNNYGDTLNSRERDLIEKSCVRDVQLIVNDCQVTRESCKSRYFITKG